jgi:hypothetical protein
MESPNDYHHTYNPGLYKFKNQEEAQKILHKVLRISDTYLIALDKAIIRSLHLDEDTWFLEEADETGIHLTFSNLSKNRSGSRSEVSQQPDDHNVDYGG